LQKGVLSPKKRRRGLVPRIHTGPATARLLALKKRPIPLGASPQLKGDRFANRIPESQNNVGLPSFRAIVPGPATTRHACFEKKTIQKGYSANSLTTKAMGFAKKPSRTRKCLDNNPLAMPRDVRPAISGATARVALMRLMEYVQTHEWR
jgi:hypothetical protein